MSAAKPPNLSQEQHDTFDKTFKELNRAIARDQVKLTKGQDLPYSEAVFIIGGIQIMRAKAKRLNSIQRKKRKVN
jgi:hypothetical protein